MTPTSASSRRSVASWLAAGLFGGLLGLAISGSAAAETSAEIRDPLEGLNRVIFGINEAADLLLIGPAADTYRLIVPDPIRDAVRNVLRNLSSPVIIANELLQGDFKGAEVASERFLVNTTLGIGGLFDIAAYNGLKYEPEDFGQTLAVWGVPDGFYMVLPLYGPSSLRDGVGLGVDSFADPVSRYTLNQGLRTVPVARTGVGATDTRSGLVETVGDLRRNSLDYYASVRSLYHQRRTTLIRDGSTHSLDIPTFEGTRN